MKPKSSRSRSKPKTGIKKMGDGWIEFYPDTPMIRSTYPSLAKRVNKEIPLANLEMHSVLGPNGLISQRKNWWLRFLNWAIGVK